MRRFVTSPFPVIAPPEEMAPATPAPVPASRGLRAPLVLLLGVVVGAFAYRGALHQYPASAEVMPWDDEYRECVLK